MSWNWETAAEGAEDTDVWVELEEPTVLLLVLDDPATEDTTLAMVVLGRDWVADEPAAEVIASTVSTIEASVRVREQHTASSR